jgi:hypothetical protein
MPSERRVSLWDTIHDYMVECARNDQWGIALTKKEVEKIFDELEHATRYESEWRKLKERYGCSFETAEEAQVVIEGNKRTTGRCAHCTGESALCDGLVLDGHWYCCHDCAAPYRRS